MEQISSTELRSHSGRYLDDALRGITRAITRNRSVPAYLVPADRYHDLTAVRVVDLAERCEVTVPDISAKVSDLCNDPEWGPERTVHEASGLSARFVRLREEAAEHIAAHFAAAKAAPAPKARRPLAGGGTEADRA